MLRRAQLLHNNVFHIQKKRRIAAGSAETVGLENAIADRCHGRGTQNRTKESASSCSAHFAVFEWVLSASTGDATPRNFRRRRKRYGKDDHHRQTGAPSAPGWTDRRSRRGRHISRGRD